MNTRFLAAFLVSVSLSGCIIRGGGGGGGGGGAVPGDVTFEWSLDGGTCADHPEVQSIRISIPGETLENGGVYPCLVAGFPGIVLHDFAPKSYSYSVEAVGFGGEQLFVGTGVFTVNGDVHQVVELRSVAQGGDVVFGWTFDGMECGPSLPDVESVRITIAGETIENGGIFPCLVAGYPGIVLYDFAPRTYAFTIEGGYIQGGDFVTLFSTSSSFAVNGDVNVNVDVQPVPGPNSYAYLTWEFPPNSASQTPNCAQAGVVYVDVSIDGGDWVRFNCADGFGTSGVVTDWLTTGTHRIELEGYGSGDYLYYRFDGTLSTTVGSPRFAEYLLPWAVGGTSVRWTLSSGSLIETCSQAGVSTVYVNFEDEFGVRVYGQFGDPQACGAAPILYNYLHGGTYAVFLEAPSTWGTWYVSDEANPPTVTIVNGEFVTASSTSLNVMMYETN